ncbi:MAG TPA: pro-sigmaK processing inhibitor BofA family protein [Lachnospiraceae bacterium]|nr:pro-sigmaK processing inhibitor BofA family protein [Lachnospiraceae bacterium]
MNLSEGAILIICICAIVLAIGAFRKKAELVINFVLRGVFGVILIFFVNSFMKMNEIDLEIGINAITVLTTGVLGFPGLVLLYGINLYKSL